MDLTGWLEFFVGGLATQLDEVKARGERIIRTDITAHAHRLNPRQALVFERLLEGGEIDMGDVELLCSGVHRRTLQRDLDGLVKRGLAKVTGAARSTRYSIGISIL